MKLEFPGFTLPGFTIQKGYLLNVELFGVRLQIPPFTIVFWPTIQFWRPFTIFDSDWILNPVANLLLAVPQAVWDWLESFIEGLVDEYYEAHPEEKE